MYVAINPVMFIMVKSRQKLEVRAQTNLQCRYELRKGDQQEIQVEEKLELLIEHDR